MNCLQVLSVLLVLSVHLRLSAVRLWFLSLQSSAARPVQRPDVHRAPHHHHTYVHTHLPSYLVRTRTNTKCSPLLCPPAARSVVSDYSDGSEDTWTLNTPHTPGESRTTFGWRHKSTSSSICTNIACVSALYYESLSSDWQVTSQET